MHSLNEACTLHGTASTVVSCFLCEQVTAQLEVSEEHIVSMVEDLADVTEQRDELSRKLRLANSRQDILAQIQEDAATELKQVMLCEADEGAKIFRKSKASRIVMKSRHRYLLDVARPRESWKVPFDASFCALRLCSDDLWMTRHFS